MRLRFYIDSQTDEEAVAKDKAALAAPAVMDAPAELVPAVRELIAKHKKSAQAKRLTNSWSGP